jgi:uncharacterized membrane protein YoaK (UPF0700 family)
VDTCGFIALFGLFTAHVTGNLVLIGAELVGPDRGILTKLTALPTFVAVVAGTRFTAGRLEAADISPVRPLLLLEAALLFGFMALGMAIEPPRHANAWPEMAAGLVGVAAMAVQNAAARILFASDLPSTVMTGNVTQVVIDLVDLCRPQPNRERAKIVARVAKTALVVGSFSLGALSGAYGFSTWGFVCLAVPALLVLALGTFSGRR